MKNNLVILLAFVSIPFFQCSKDGKRRETVVGEWTFRSKTIQIGPYPSMFSNGTPSSISTESSTSNGVRVSFNLDGNFTFFYYDKPPQLGRFKIIVKNSTSGISKGIAFNTSAYSFTLSADV